MNKITIHFMFCFLLAWRYIFLLCGVSDIFPLLVSLAVNSRSLYFLLLVKSLNMASFWQYVPFCGYDPFADVKPNKSSGRMCIIPVIIFLLLLLGLNGFLTYKGKALSVHQDCKTLSPILEYTENILNQKT